ncbi:ethylbenzene dehydrogenase-related protein [Roseovarius nitratireducens]|uniref:ethylbenzene dehydrogenase-related protein n=1 Tax=Roseovarius nitratireducens TaxID=2044597 RepID=UPI000CE20078|nr:ethylbenzene dehydrogenase-related protein [Roseovarius nitratireducens]
MKLPLAPMIGLATGVLAALSLPSNVRAESAVDWSAIPTTTLTLFYPGQSGYDWLRSSDHKRAYSKVIEGDSCVSCHEGEEKDIGQLIVTGERLEPDPIEGKNPTVDLAMQVAYDDENTHFRFQWKTQMDRPGQMHNYIRYNGEAWEFYGSHRASSKVRSGEQPPLYEDRLAIMVDDGSVPNFAAQGCWLSCHNGMRDMPEEASKDDIASNPILGSEGLNKSDIRKYLPPSRTDEETSWDATKLADEIAALKAEGKFVDLMQWRAARSAPVGMADDGYVLEYRLFDAGKNPFSWNVDRKTMTPKFMFDAEKVGVKAITVDDIGDPSKPYVLIHEENVVAYDPDAGWKAGDVLPGRLVSRAGAEGSAADNDQVTSKWEDGVWTVEWTRKRDTGHPEDDKIIEDGKAYNFGFAVHDDNVTTRFHYVGFPVSIGFGAEGDIQATPLQ